VRTHVCAHIHTDICILLNCCYKIFNPFQNVLVLTCAQCLM